MAGPESAGERGGWEGLEKPQVGSIASCLRLLLLLHLYPLTPPL